MKKILLAFVLVARSLYAQVDPLEGLWQGYDGEWGHVSRQLVALAQAIPQQKYGWRPGPGVRPRVRSSWLSRIYGLGDLPRVQPQNGHIESFNGRLRDECLNASWFINLQDARRKDSGLAA
jgi:hypothetical protein